MKRLSIVAALALCAAISCTSFAQRTGPADVSAPAAQAADASPWALQWAAHDAISEDAAKSADAIRTLRAVGPKGLEALLSANASAIVSTKIVAMPTPAELRLRAAADQVAMQKDALSSRLYWYTDFDQAKAAAAAAKKPILSLRMLGKLSEDLSCANSRFFRTTLYANAEVSGYLREHFILHWESVRPVPVITIDMGDGRKVVRTITGNSIHYVLDCQGRLIDGIPGLYGANAFLTALRGDAAMAQSFFDVRDDVFVLGLKTFHSRALSYTSANWKADLERAGGTLAAAGGGPASDAVKAVSAGKAPNAVVAARIAVGKGAVEIPILVQVMPDGKALESSTSDELWTKIAALHAADAVLDDSVKKLMLAKSPDLAKAAMLATASKRMVENPLLAITHNLRDSIALDTVRNEYLLHSKVHEWLAQSEKPVAGGELKIFNERVYAELFLTPSSDPWLGLVPANTYSALDNGGICTMPPIGGSAGGQEKIR